MTHTDSSKDQNDEELEKKHKQWEIWHNKELERARIARGGDEQFELPFELPLDYDKSHENQHKLFPEEELTESPQKSIDKKFPFGKPR